MTNSYNLGKAPPTPATILSMLASEKVVFPGGSSRAYRKELEPSPSDVVGQAELF